MNFIKIIYYFEFVAIKFSLIQTNFNSSINLNINLILNAFHSKNYHSQNYHFENYDFKNYFYFE